MSGVDVNEVLLPGIGLRYEFTSAEGRRIGIVARREGNFEVVTYDRSDPDQSRLLLKLTAEEADTVAEILGAPRIAERFADLTKEVPGLSAGQIEVGPGSPYVGRPMGETRARTRTGASIVAIVRGDDVIASPPPSEALHAGDVLVVIGTPGGITGVDQIIHT
jgi:TrkA domain protein